MRAKSAAENPRMAIKQTAIAFPITNCAVELAVGAKLFVQDSLSTLQFHTN